MGIVHVYLSYIHLLFNQRRITPAGQVLFLAQLVSRPVRLESHPHSSKFNRR